MLDRSKFPADSEWSPIPDIALPDMKLGESQRHESLTIFPLLDPVARSLPYLLLADALQVGIVQLVELGTGTVPEVLVENDSELDVLILDGEQLIGAKQNRTVSRTILVPARTKITLPVSCMEHGRWRFTSGRFRHAGHHSPSKVRRHARKAEADCAASMMRASPSVLARAQGAVWSEIADSSVRLGGRSPTGALDHLYELKALDLDAWSKRFPWVDDQVGLIAFLGEKPLGLDMIGGHRLYARLHKRLVTGYIMDAFTAGPSYERIAVGADSAAAFLKKVRGANRTAAPTVGRGTYRVLSGRVMGGELEDKGGLVHLSAFPR